MTKNEKRSRLGQRRALWARWALETGFELQGKSGRIDLAQCNPVQFALSGPTCWPLPIRITGRMEQRDSDQNLDSLRQQIVGLEDELEETATQLKAACDRYQYLLAVTPGVIYTTQG